ncbi:hypothetical protein EDB85DRAFT_2154969 [Lactarius pseudohatsudake]|nr:hypothetical protein EDB85DRAFT_2154969 [Lactarius pseudohatsudake]
MDAATLCNYSRFILLIQMVTRPSGYDPTHPIQVYTQAMAHPTPHIYYSTGDQMRFAQLGAHGVGLAASSDDGMGVGDRTGMEDSGRDFSDGSCSAAGCGIYDTDTRAFNDLFASDSAPYLVSGAGESFSPHATLRRPSPST